MVFLVFMQSFDNGKWKLCCNRMSKHWKESICDLTEHKGKVKQLCGFMAPFRLFMFPSIKTFWHQRKTWIKLLKRQYINKTAWKPCSSDIVCCEHFVDGIPTEQNPNPILKLGYRKIAVQTRIPPIFRTFVKKSASSTPVSTNNLVLISPPMSPIIWFS